jgi:hypothetical protein
MNETKETFSDFKAKDEFDPLGSSICSEKKGETRIDYN